VGLDSAVIVGHAMGSTNAARFAIDFPRRASGLVLVGMFASYRNNAPLVDHVATTVSRLQIRSTSRSPASSRRARSRSPYRRTFSTLP
jgi:pimeloyl-ACP methyl ester carboxylesterase